MSGCFRSFITMDMCNGGDPNKALRVHSAPSRDSASTSGWRGRLELE